METKINDQELLDKCIRCKRKDVELIQLTRHVILGQINLKTFQINFSVCRDCKLKLDKFLKFEEFYKKRTFPRIIAAILFFIYIITIGMLFLRIISDVFTLIIYVVILTIVAASAFFGSLLLNRFLYEYHPENINKYLEIRENGTAIIKDPKNEMQTVYVNLLKHEQEKVEKIQKESFNFCPNCGSNIKTYTGFCSVCGKNLRVKKKED